MEVIIILLPLALLLAGIFIGSFIWTTIKGQYDDLETPKYKLLLDDKYLASKKEENKE